MKMKALLLSLVLAALTIGQASAQKFDLGVEAGANFSNFIGEDVNSTLGSAAGSKLGFVGGAFLCLNFGNVIGIRPEILYEQKGAAISGTSTTDELDYVEVPVLLKFAFGTPVVNPALLIGPSFNWNTVSTIANNTSNISVNSSEIGLMGGLEVDIDKFLVSGRYELGLTNATQNKNIQNGTITLLVGYSFI